VSREGAIASLRRGKVENALLGGKPSGKILADVVFGAPRGAATEPVIYVQLPPAGNHPNTKRYPIAITGAGYRGILTSDATRIRGLVPIADIAPTLVALRDGRRPPIGSEPDPDVRSDLRALDGRLERIHDDRGWTLTAVVLTVLALAAAVPWAAVLGGAAAIAGSLLLSWAGATRLWVLILAMLALTIGLSLAGSVRRRLVPISVAVFFVVYLIVLALSTETNSLAVLGARPDGGGRFYGMTNQVETLLLAPLIAAVAVAGVPGLLPLGALALVTVGWSKAGADGGGLLVFGAGLAVLALRLRALPLTPRRLALAGVAVVVIALALVGLDATLGGSSHVTRAVGTGPGSLLGDLGHRLHLSWKSGTEYWHRGLTFLGCLAALVWMGTIRPRRATVDAMLAALAVSLLVNDTPVDVVGLGALGCAALVRFESVDSRPMRRGVLTAACVFVALALPGCGDQGVVTPTPKQVVGTVKKEAPGKSIFLAQGCNACHTFAPAGSNATIGPDLGKLPDYAQTAKQPLATFVHESIVDPNKYVEKGFPNGMPTDYGKKLSDQQLNDLVDFLTKPQG
jgi:mono/diheme cytochrome c family protein